MRFFGAGAVQSPDKIGETINLSGLNCSFLRFISDEHAFDKSSDDTPNKNGSWNLVGAVTYNKKIFSEKDCENPRQLKVWQAVQAPFLYVEGETIPEHPNAQAVDSVIRFCAANPEIPLKVGLSIEGLILKRGSDDKNNPSYKNLDQSLAEGVAVTIRPAHPKAVIFPWVDLAKSDTPVKIPENMMKSLMEMPEAQSSFKHRPELTIKRKIESLRKSIDDVKKGGSCAVKCWGCNHSERMFKSSLTNRCSKCGSAFSMSDIWNSLNK